MSSTAEKSYNGWANYETWAVALWIDNEEESYVSRQALARQAWRDAEGTHLNRLGTGIDFTRSEQARISFAGTIEQWVDGMRPELEASLWSDLLSAAFSEVDWLEIADNWLSEMDGYVPRESQ
jgi:hypothetical protein